MGRTVRAILSTISMCPCPLLKGSTISIAQAPNFIAALLLIATGLAGCGGGGDSDGSIQPQAVAPTVTVQPQNATVNVGQSVTFSVTASGSAPLSYQWRVGGTSINGATSASFVLASPAMGDNNAVYSVVVSNSTGSVTSANATLTVTPITTAVVVTETDTGTPVTSGGAWVLVDDIVVAQLDGSGMATISTAAGTHKITVLDGGSSGELMVTIVAGQTNAAVAVTDSEGAYVPSTATIPQIVNGVYDTTDSSQSPATLQLMDAAGNPIVIASIRGLLANGSQKTVDIESLFQITNGQVTLDFNAAFTMLGDGLLADGVTNGPFSLDFEASDAAGAPYGGVIRFDAGAFVVTGQVAAPPSNPSLPVGNLTLTFAKHGSPVVIAVVPQTNGHFNTSGLPSGTYDVTGSVANAGITYRINGGLTLTGDTTITITPLGPTDLVAGIPPITVQSVNVQNLRTEAVRTRQTARPGIPKTMAFKTAASTLGSVPLTGPYGAAIMVTGADADNEVTQSAAFTIPTGTTSASLLYQVCSEEYPDFVLTHSPFDDRWALIATDPSGADIASVLRTVNDQLLHDPVWQGDGCTAVIEVPITLAPDGTLISVATRNTNIEDAVLTVAPGGTVISVAIRSTNIEDSNLPTTVTAIVTGSSSSDPFKIQSFKLNPWTSGCGTASANTANIEICPGANDGDYISIPTVLQKNTFSRRAQAVVVAPPGMPLPTITHVRLDLVDLGGAVLDTLIDEAPEKFVTSTSNTLEFPITYDNIYVPPNLRNPPARVTYKLTVSGIVGTATFDASKNLTVFNTLVRATDNGVVLDRYGGVPRDLGQDDWTTANGYQWMIANAALLTRFDDISGEHGRNIKHLEHGRGTDIDIFQFKSLNSASGQKNYDALRDAAIKAIDGDPISKQTVADWIRANKIGIDNLLGNSDVVKVYSGRGDCFGKLKDGWLQSAMQHGEVPYETHNCGPGQPSILDLGTGEWSTGSVFFKNDHNSHVHVTLSLP